ncbi:MAG: hypothetical protein MH204_06435 [Fimbriimonadaceae bacterium]|nr:hypothetical protein [Fimbriimonadaceae bacterium]
MTEAVRDLWRFLTFRFTAADYERLDLRHLGIGMLITWLVGIARNWDLPNSPLHASLGLASVAYVLIFSTILWAFTLPFATGALRWTRVLTFVCLTAAPGLIYGIPVEMMMSMEAAQTTNLGFLVIVAAWRVALAIHFLRVGLSLKVVDTLTVLLTPICMMIVGLLITGRAGQVLKVMGGVRDAPATRWDVSDDFLFLLAVLSIPGLAFGILAYLSLLAFRSRK